MALKIERKLILASASPSRKMLLEQAGLDFEVVVSGVDETVPSDYTPAQTVEALAQRKGQAVQALRPEAPIIAADSVVSIDGLILGKPKDDEAAKATLRRLSGRTHELITGVCLLINGQMDLFHQVTRVTFYPLTEEEIAEYVALGESPGPGRSLRHRRHRRGAGPVHPGGLSQHCGPARGGDAPPPGQIAGSVTGTRTGPPA